MPLQFPRTKLFADPAGKFLHDVVLDSCRRHHAKVAIVDASCEPATRITYAAYGEMVSLAAIGMVAADIQPSERIAIFLPNCWEFGVAYHAATLAGAVPTTLNPTYREREVRYQLESSDAVALITDGSLLEGIDLNQWRTRIHAITRFHKDLSNHAFNLWTYIRGVSRLQHGNIL